MKSLISKKGLCLFFLFVLQSMLFPGPGFAQIGQRVFYIVEYIKVLPGKSKDFLKLQKEIIKPLQQERLKKSSLLSWSLYQNIFPSGTNETYDYISVCIVKDWNSIEKIFTGSIDVISKSLNREQLLFWEKSDQIFSGVKNEIWSQEEIILKSPSGPPPKYHLANYMKIPEGKMNDYLKMERTFVKPVHEEHIKTGGRAGWALYIIHQPSGAEVPYHAATVDFYDRWDQLGNPDQTAFWQQIHPDKSPEYIEKQITATRILLRQELRVLVDFVQ